MVVVPTHGSLYMDIDKPKTDFVMGIKRVTKQDIISFINATNHKIQSPCGDLSRDTDGQLEIEIDSSYSWSTPGYDAADTDPVVCIGWDDAQAYADWLSTRSGVTYRLLTFSEAIYFASRYAIDKPSTVIDGLLVDGEVFDTLEWVRDCWSDERTSADDVAVIDSDECVQVTAATIDPTTLKPYRIDLPSEFSARHIGFRLARDLNLIPELD